MLTMDMFTSEKILGLHTLSSQNNIIAVQIQRNKEDRKGKLYVEQTESDHDMFSHQKIPYALKSIAHMLKVSSILQLDKWDIQWCSHTTNMDSSF